MYFLVNCLILVSLVSLNDAESNIKRYAIPVGGSVSLECESDFPAMWSRNKDGKTTNLANGRLVLPEISKDRYHASVKGKQYVLALKNALLDDSSEILCNNKNNFHIQVVPNPTCSKMKEVTHEDEQVNVKCELKLQSETAKPRLSWNMGSDKIFETLDQSEGIFKYTAKFLDHDKPLKCVVHVDHWNQNLPKPSCSYGKIHIRFFPRIQCQSRVSIPSGQSETTVSCKINANPLPALNAVKWEVVRPGDDYDADNEKLNLENLIVNGEIVTSIKLTRDYLSRQRPSLNLKLSTNNPLFDKKETISTGTSLSKTITKEIKIDMILGPEIACPSRKRLKKDDAKFSCDVYVNPLPPTANISWDLGGKIVRQNKQMIAKIQGGIRVEIPIKTIKNEFDHNEDQRLNPY